MVFSLSMFPVGKDGSLAEPIAQVIDEIDRAGLEYRVTGADTVIEGEWGRVMPAIQRAEERLREKHDRVYMVLTMDDHAGASERLQRSVEDVEQELGRSIRH